MIPMSFAVDVHVVFRARQGLPSPLRAGTGKGRAPGEEVEVSPAVGRRFRRRPSCSADGVFDTDAFDGAVTLWSSRSGRSEWDWSRGVLIRK